MSIASTARARAARLRARLRSRLDDDTDADLAPWQLTDEDRRYLRSWYPDEVPLPPGSAETLRADSPRLAELRDAYAKLDLPVTVHSQWDSANVAGYLDLAHFRGDSMIQWHYREAVRTTRLKWFVYLNHIQRIDDRELLSRVTEDGLFGCWTYEYEGRPMVSRDLLESINELLFLGRAVDLFERPNLRVVDIGAGYGRLAERMCVAAPNIADYCCVDAIPESTFLSEYYLSFRGLVPPARVVPLHEIDALDHASFDLALNVHSFSECTASAVGWWLERIGVWDVPQLFIVPNEPQGFLSRELDQSRVDLMPLFERAGYRVVASEPVISDPAVRELMRVDDVFYVFERR